MSTISSPASVQATVRAKQPALPPSSPPSAVVSPEALDALLQSGPNNAREPKRPDAVGPTPQDIKTMMQDLNDLDTEVDMAAIERMLRAPDSIAAKALFEKIKALLTPENLKALLKDGNGASFAPTLGRIETRFIKGAIEPHLTPLEREQVEAYRKHVDSQLFNLKYQLSTAAPDSRLEMIRSFAKQIDNPLEAARGRLKELGAKATVFYDIATLVRKSIEALQYAHVDNWEQRQYEPDKVKQPNIYRYTHIGESSLDSPSEIRGFVHGQDKLDVSGIQKQLNKPLHWVNQLSGASGEMQLRYSRENNASVLVISGPPGEPPFVVKVFGQLKENDLLT